MVEKLSARSILEIGVQNGGSLEVWSKIYPDALHILGVDVDPACGDLQFEHPAIRVLVADASIPETAREIILIAGELDLVIDDGSHASPHIIGALVNFLPALARGGHYVIEDLSASYWPSWGGGLFVEASANNFLKRLSDLVNLEHWRATPDLESFLRAPVPLTEAFLEASKRIKTISFSNSFCVIEMIERDEYSSIGLREQAGHVATVSQNMFSENGLAIQQKLFDGEKVEQEPIDLNQALQNTAIQLAELKKYSALVGEQNEDLKREMVALGEQNEDLKREMVALGEQNEGLVLSLEQIKNSKTWRWTSWIRRLFAGSRKS